MTTSIRELSTFFCFALLLFCANANMTTSIRELSTFFCFTLLLFCANEVHTVEALCGKPSGTWSGPCLNSYQCDNQCKAREAAVAGGCQDFACYCYFECHNP